MTKTLHIYPAAFAAATLAVALLGQPRMARASAQNAGATAQPQQDSISTRDAEARLNKPQFNNVKVKVTNGIATLTGEVSLYQYKADAGKRVGNAKGVAAVRNMVEVGGATVPDDKLRSELTEKLSYDRVGYGNVFNAVSLQIENGIVTLGGHARTYMDRDSAIALTATTPGVKGLVDTIEVDPVSQTDDQLRIRVARAVYGNSSLNKYALDPAKAIRISVQNGHVSLYGMVDSQTDKDAAFLSANSVPDVFSVNNYLKVTNQPEEDLRK